MNARIAASRSLPLKRLAASLALLLALPAVAENMDARPENLADLSIEELANIPVMSVSKRPERLQDAAAAVFVITSEDIRRSGAATLPEVLRLAPNLHVARISGYSYSISARGLNQSGNSYSNKLLVLIDGRSVYTPLFSGVFWDAQEVLLEDVERIEVISGPGGVMWGLNAVNGVINITTRSARETQGSMAVLQAATDGVTGSFRQGGTTANGVAWRAFGKTTRREDSELASGAPVNDAYRRTLVGARADWERGPDRVSLIGNAYRGRFDQPFPGEIAAPGVRPTLGQVRSDGLNLTARWEHALDDGASLMAQAYFDHTLRRAEPLFGERLYTTDLQFQHTLAPSGAHRVVWGANYRHSRDRVDNSPTVAFLPARTTQQWASVFAQDEIALRQDLFLTLGSRVEYNEYTGVEWLPSARLSWRMSPQHALWAAASRTVRAPSRLDVDAYLPGRPPFLLRGGARVRGEVARVFELGYRGNPVAPLSYSMTLFHHDYDYLRTTETNPAGFITFDSLMEGRSSGIEAWGSWQAAERWRLSAGWTALHQKLRLKPGSTDVNATLVARRDPAHTFQLRSVYGIDDRRDVELTLRKVAGKSFPDVPSYTALDARFGWRVRPGLELSVTGESLTGGHGEYGSILARAEIERRLGVKVVWEY
ncbi:TonB-dependent siderophore receptor [Massilia sp. IC2-476]|uniref:TonB-dependent receptor plug domain-containing protein n=1 Tax=Massilia sp. IC2-476 TaxID=2887199 RepID=UPI001D1291D9|nr:TonB-dependent receptor [Massilia sp. IC2-476]MCC2974840.1 TonB-dependent receptor [Massilia sp. IC2-476]